MMKANLIPPVGSSGVPEPLRQHCARSSSRNRKSSDPSGRISGVEHVRSVAIQHVGGSPRLRRRKALPELHEELDYRNRADDLGSAPGLGGLLHTAIEIAAQRRTLLGTIRAALERRDHAEVIRLVSRLCGANNEKSSGADSGFNGRTGRRDKRQHPRAA